ncbi:MAG: hypothetical protein L3J87_01090 [Thermoplasmata archaeon]|nr:hypothetical protein [Thermoplasmata archaeon]
MIAETFFEAERIPGWISSSAGIEAGSAISPAAVELLRAVGFQPVARKPRSVRSEMIRACDLVVTFGCSDRLPGGPVSRVEDWPIPGGFGKTDEERRAIRDLIRRRVAELGERLRVSDDHTAGDH